ncbi:N alpha-acetyl-transferase [Recurvomyces mirabilis]|nr:N alpha-acetyl-transferase [Recurvomyces mirabilis]
MAERTHDDYMAKSRDKDGNLASASYSEALQCAAHSVESLNFLHNHAFEKHMAAKRFEQDDSMSYAPPPATWPEKELQIDIKSGTTLTQGELKAYFELLEDDSRDDYEDAMGSSDDKVLERDIKDPQSKNLSYEGISLRGTGVGRHLLYIIESVAEEAEVERVFVRCFEANQESINFFVQMGYAKDTRIQDDRKLNDPYQERMDDALLWKWKLIRRPGIDYSKKMVSRGSLVDHGELSPSLTGSPGSSEDFAGHGS